MSIGLIPVCFSEMVWTEHQTELNLEPFNTGSVVHVLEVGFLEQENTKTACYNSFLDTH